MSKKNPTASEIWDTNIIYRKNVLEFKTPSTSVHHKAQAPPGHHKHHHYINDKSIIAPTCPAGSSSLGSRRVTTVGVSPNVTFDDSQIGMMMMMMTRTSCKSSKPSTVSSVKVSHSSACFHLRWHDFEYNGDFTGTLDHYGDCRDDWWW